MKIDQDIKVAMRDGVQVSLCVYRPAGDAQVPALFAASPYQHEFDTVPAFPLFLWRETGPVEWYVRQGYAYVHADVRGSGRSEGEFGFMDRTEQQGYVELIAWIIKQPWCNGRVGGIGTRSIMTLRMRRASCCRWCRRHKASRALTPAARRIP